MPRRPMRTSMPNGRILRELQVMVAIPYGTPDIVAPAPEAWATRPWWACAGPSSRGSPAHAITVGPLRGLQC